MKHILVCLHGWGGSKESFDDLKRALSGSDIEVLTPDLPGFGMEPEPPHPFTVDDYADWVVGWLTKRLAISDKRIEWELLGHSHGGRIATKLVTGRLQAQSFQLPARLYLCAAAGIRRPRHFKRIVGLLLAKTGKFFLAIPGFKNLEPLGKKLLYRLVRVHDYENASPVMRQTLIEITKEDLRPLLPKITVPTEIFWGEDDHMTPIEDGRIMAKEIPHAVLHTFPGTRHAVHKERAKEIGG